MAETLNEDRRQAVEALLSAASLAGITNPETLIQATAIGMSASGGNVNKVSGGGTGIDDGPLVGVWQIQSLKSQTDTGKPQDIERLKDLRFNARAMFVLSNGGTNWSSWPQYTSGQYLPWIDKVKSTFDPVPISAIGNPIETIGEALLPPGVSTGLDVFNWLASVQLPSLQQFLLAVGGVLLIGVGVAIMVTSFTPAGIAVGSVLP